MSPGSLRASWRLAFASLLALAAVPAFAGQATDPKAAFVDAFAQFSLALDGTYGDEADAVRSSLEAMERGLARWDATILTYEAAMASEIGSADPPVAARMHSALGSVYLDRSRFADALREFTAANQLDASRAGVHFLQGIASIQLANNPSGDTRATEAFRKATALEPGDSVYAYVLARHLISAGEQKEAAKTLRLFDEARILRATDPNRAAAALPFIQIGLAQEKAGVEPFFPPVLYAEGFALIRRGDYAGAIRQFKEAATHDRLSAQPINKMEALGRAAAAFRDGSLEIAVQHLKVAAELAPDSSEPHRLLGRVYLANQKNDDGVKELRIAVGLGHTDERTHLALADALVEAGQDPAAERTLLEIIGAFPGSGRAHYTLGRLYQREGRYPEAVSELRKAATFGPLLGLNSLYQTIGAINVDQQDFEAAIDAYAKRAEINPNDPDAHQDLGRLYARLDRRDEARGEFAVVLMLDPNHAEAYAALAQMHLRDEEYSAAAELARRALALVPGHQQAQYALGTSLMRLGRTQEGQQELEVFRRLQIEAATARSRQIKLEGIKGAAVLSSAGGDNEKAVALLREALTYEPEAAFSHMDLGRALIKAGQTAEAIEHFKSAVALNAHFDVHRDLADAYAALGRLDESRQEHALYERLRQESLRSAGANR